MRVRVDCWRDPYHGREGVVVEPGAHEVRTHTPGVDPGVKVRLDGEPLARWFGSDQVVLIG